MGHGLATELPLCNATNAQESSNHEELHHVLLGDSEKAAASWEENLTGPVLAVFKDGKLLVDFQVFLRQNNPALAVALWKLDLVRFAPHLKQDSEGVDFSADQALVDNLAEAWKQYLASPDGKLNLEDVSEWEKIKLASTNSAAKEDVANGTEVNDQHAMYKFALHCMFGIHAATVSNSLFLDALAFGLGDEDSVNAWHASFSHHDIVDCLHRSVRVFRIPSQGSAYSPPTSELTNGLLDEAYTFEEFCPQLFSEMRKRAGVTNEEYFSSLCRIDFEFIAFGTNSKSGEFFFFSHDEKFLLKTTTVDEAQMLMTMLPDLLGRFEATPHSMLGKYLGLYRVEGKLFFVMQAVTVHGHDITRTYDLKGSTRNRQAKPMESIGKDVNFENELGKLDLDPIVRQQLMETHQGDVEVLRHHNIMDFSLLLQVHDRNPPKKRGPLQGTRKDHSKVVKLSGNSSSGSIPLLMNHGSWFQAAAVSTPRPRPKQNAAITFSTSGITPSQVDWTPNTGIESADGRFIFTFGLIDILVPFSLYPKVQYVAEQVRTCGSGNEYSRVPAGYYCDRQVAMFQKILGATEDGEVQD